MEPTLSYKFTLYSLHSYNLDLGGSHHPLPYNILWTIEATYEIRVFLKGAQKEVFSSIFKKSL
jgi:hypothetical protein